MLFAKSSGARKALNTVSAAWEASADVACVAKSGTRSKRYAQDIAGIVAKANVRNFNVKEDRNRTACSKMYHELKVDGVWCIGASSLLLLGNTRLVHHGRKHNRRHLACPGLWFYPTTCNQSRAKLRLYHTFCDRRCAPRECYNMHLHVIHVVVCFENRVCFKSHAACRRFNG